MADAAFAAVEIGDWRSCPHGNGRSSPTRSSPWVTMPSLVPGWNGSSRRTPCASGSVPADARALIVRPPGRWLESYQDAPITLVDEPGRARQPARACTRRFSVRIRELEHGPLRPNEPQPDTTESLPSPDRAVRGGPQDDHGRLCRAVDIVGSRRQPGSEALRHVTNRARSRDRGGRGASTARRDLYGRCRLHGLRAAAPHPGRRRSGDADAVEFRERLMSLAAEIATERDVELGFGVGIGTGEVVTGGDGRAAAGDRHPAGGSPRPRPARRSRCDPRRRGNPAARPDSSARRTGRGRADPAFRVLGLAEGTRATRAASSRPWSGGSVSAGGFRMVDQAAGDRSRQLFTVLGPAGVGKSGLVRSSCRAWESRTPWREDAAFRTARGITFWPCSRHWEAVGLDDADLTRGRARELGRCSSSVRRAERSFLAERVAETIGLADVRGAARMVTSVLALVQALARGRPLVLVFDDIHWGEPIFLDLVEHIADWARVPDLARLRPPRPARCATRLGGGNSRAVRASSLSVEECALLIANLVGRAELPWDVEARIVEAAEGNPLFVEEMLSMLIDDGVLVQQNGGWLATVDLPALRVPPTIQALSRQGSTGSTPTTARSSSSARSRASSSTTGIVDLVSEDLGLRPVDPLASLVCKELIRPGRPALGGRCTAPPPAHPRPARDSIPKQARAAAHERVRPLARAQLGETRNGVRGDRRLSPRGVHPTATNSAASMMRSRSCPGWRWSGSGGWPARLLTQRCPRCFEPHFPCGLAAAAAGSSRVDLCPERPNRPGMEDLTWADEVLTDAVEAARRPWRQEPAAHALVQRGLLRLFVFSQPRSRSSWTSPTRRSRCSRLEMTSACRGPASSARPTTSTGEVRRARRPPSVRSHAQRADDRFEATKRSWSGSGSRWFLVPHRRRSRAEVQELPRDVTGHPAAEVNLLGSSRTRSRFRVATTTSGARGAPSRLEPSWMRGPPLVPGPSLGVSLGNEPHLAEALRPTMTAQADRGEERFSSITSVLAQALYALAATTRPAARGGDGVEPCSHDVRRKSSGRAHPRSSSPGTLVDAGRLREGRVRRD